jgi:hypothetical protein
VKARLPEAVKAIQLYDHHDADLLQWTVQHQCHWWATSAQAAAGHVSEPANANHKASSQWVPRKAAAAGSLEFRVLLKSFTFPISK